jgi:hypothetical protein
MYFFLLTFMMSPVDDSHGLQTETLHVYLGREKETVVEVVEEDSGVRDQGSGSAHRILLQQQAQEVMAYPDFVL